MPDNEFSIDDMLNTAVDGRPNAFADVFTGVMNGKVGDKVDQVRAHVAAKLAGLDPTDDPALEAGPEEEDDETELEADDISDEEIEDAANDELDNEEEVIPDEDDEAVPGGTEDED
tara:strand:- start:76 stop:423 length:348 start_codon:yes stop_codon:yes gene_type:complete